MENLTKDLDDIKGTKVCEFYSSELRYSIKKNKN